MTDGFTGNVALKTMEGVARFIGGVMREEFTRSPLRKIGGLAAAPSLKALKSRLDPSAYNGASMVGLAGVVIKSHGGANRVAFASAVRVAVTEARKGVPDQIGELMARVSASIGLCAAVELRAFYDFPRLRRRILAMSCARRRPSFAASVAASRCATVLRGIDLR